MVKPVLTTIMAFWWPGKVKTMLSLFIAEKLEEVVGILSRVFFLQYFVDNKDEKLLL